MEATPGPFEHLRQKANMRTLIILLGLSWGILSAQSDIIDLNNLHCSISPNGSLFQDENNWGLCQVKNSAFKAVMFTGHLWLAAEANNNLYTAAQDYYLAQDPNYVNSDFRFGPIADDPNLSAYQNRYYRVWKISSSMIDQHIQNYTNPGYQILDEIADWPAHGDTNNGEAWLLAPFVDLNGNSIYEPLQGDYPKIRGHQSIYCIFNDANRSQARTNTSELGFEIHLQAYAYNPGMLAPLENALFFSYRIINRSPHNYESVYAGQWYDSDLGFSFDDICGSDSSLALSYTYNADSIDDPGQGFGFNPPAVGFSLLNGNPGGAMYYHNSSSPNIPLEMTNPSLPQHWRNYLMSHWTDGSALSLENPSGLYNASNGDGFDTTASAQASLWAFNDQANWYCAPQNLSDKRQLLNLEPQSLAQGDTICMDLMLSYARDLGDQNPYAPVDKLKNELGALHIFWQAKNYQCWEPMLGRQEQALAMGSQVYPNPFKDELVIQSPIREKMHVELFNAQGEKVLGAEIDQSPYILGTGGLKAGVYFLSLKSKNQSTKVKRVIKVN